MQRKHSQQIGSDDYLSTERFLALQTLPVGGLKSIWFSASDGEQMEISRAFQRQERDHGFPTDNQYLLTASIPHTHDDIDPQTFCMLNQCLSETRGYPNRGDCGSILECRWTNWENADDQRI